MKKKLKELHRIMDEIEIFKTSEPLDQSTKKIIISTQKKFTSAFFLCVNGTEERFTNMIVTLPFKFPNNLNKKA